MSRWRQSGPTGEMLRCYCTADWSGRSEVKSGLAAVVGEGGAVRRRELREKRKKYFELDKVM